MLWLWAPIGLVLAIGYIFDHVLLRISGASGISVGECVEQPFAGCVTSHCVHCHIRADPRVIQDRLAAVCPHDRAHEHAGHAAVKAKPFG